MSVTQLRYPGLGVSNIDDWKGFATQVLVVQANGRDDDDTLYLRMDEYNHRFNVPPKANNDVAYIGWEVVSEQDLSTAAEQLSAAGVNDATWQVQMHASGSIWGHKRNAKRAAGCLQASDLHSRAA
jgi:hypothetical protein